MFAGSSEEEKLNEWSYCFFQSHDWWSVFKSLGMVAFGYFPLSKPLYMLIAFAFIFITAWVCLLSLCCLHFFEGLLWLTCSILNSVLSSHDWWSVFESLGTVAFGFFPPYEPLYKLIIAFTVLFVSIYRGFFHSIVWSLSEILICFDSCLKLRIIIFIRERPVLLHLKFSMWLR